MTGRPPAHEQHQTAARSPGENFSPTLRLNVTRRPSPGEDFNPAPRLNATHRRSPGENSRSAGRPHATRQPSPSQHPDQQPSPSHQPVAGERGSVTPLVLGMVVCLLLLGAGVTAGTSVFLARQQLQSACDGAAAAAASADRAGLAGGSESAARQYLAARNLEVGIRADQAGGSVVLTCSASAAITFGALFGVATMTQTVQAVGRSVL